MSSLWLVIIGMGIVLICGGCNFQEPGNGTVHENSYLADPERVALNPLPYQIINEVGGDIAIVAGHDSEVAADAIDMGTGLNTEAALLEAEHHFTLTQSANEVRVKLVSDGQNIDPQDRAALHVRVPASLVLSSVQTHAGSIGLFGNIGSVTAAIKGKGDILARGVDGDVNLSAENGSIVADVTSGRSVMVQAAGGDIEIMAVDAIVSAITTKGNVRFVGTLRPNKTHTFTTTGTGSVDIAVPAFPPNSDQWVRVSAATSVNSIEADYPARRRDNSAPLTICGVIHSAGPYDYHIENIGTHFGRIKVSPSQTTTFYLTATLSAAYLRFDTNRPQISIFAPVPQSIHIYTEADLSQMNTGPESVDPGCKDALKPNLSQPTTVVNISAERGRIVFHHTNMLNH